MKYDSLQIKTFNSLSVNVIVHENCEIQIINGFLLVHIKENDENSRKCVTKVYDLTKVIEYKTTKTCNSQA